ncbi:hypothetical protein SAMD00019534_106910 [Acytostelium subglobosum LB1]|uniref:hypothetical protein n=1 Tax=Acytostelium subglobosum LB1 TaxID=1410327 RepID=UPI0006452104|nr:hypothetical protein SAMD00019534_106910 [Acytostelium subglobosum LB1]GAM27515.1 hypothetical protein SAMD00019534_106910 [Acytostelium subglobosum LB1]|eukprot:XP_012749580.1 hypothetical protein SAMD00019534_106910 [Acytostelium subglobosum LB1]
MSSQQIIQQLEHQLQQQLVLSDVDDRDQGQGLALPAPMQALWVRTVLEHAMPRSMDASPIPQVMFGDYPFNVTYETIRLEGPSWFLYYAALFGLVCRSWYNLVKDFMHARRNDLNLTLVEIHGTLFVPYKLDLFSYPRLIIFNHNSKHSLIRSENLVMATIESMGHPCYTPHLFTQMNNLESVYITYHGDEESFIDTIEALLEASNDQIKINVTFLDEVIDFAEYDGLRERLDNVTLEYFGCCEDLLTMDSAFEELRGVLPNNLIVNLYNGENEHNAHFTYAPLFAIKSLRRLTIEHDHIELADLIELAKSQRIEQFNGILLFHHILRQINADRCRTRTPSEQYPHPQLELVADSTDVVTLKVDPKVHQPLNDCSAQPLKHRGCTYHPVNLEQHIVDFCQALKSNTTLKHLALTSFQCAEIGHSIASWGSKKQHVTDRYTDEQSSPDSTADDDEHEQELRCQPFIDHFSTLFLFNNTLQHLHLSNIYIINDEFFKCLETNQSLLALVLTDGAFGRGGVHLQALANMIRSNKTLHTLSIQRNQLKHFGDLPSALQSSNTLRSLDISGNKVIDIASVAMFDALEISDHLEYLVISPCMKDASNHYRSTSSSLKRVLIRDDEASQDPTFYTNTGLVSYSPSDYGCLQLARYD